MSLERITELLLRDCFHGQACVKCGHPAHRMARGQFYCAHHFPYGPLPGTRNYRVYKHPRLANGPH
jgi:hypothetical protein